MVDTLRADHLHYAGDPRNATPRFDALARESTWFRNAYAASSWTLPSVASLLLSEIPSQHRVVRWGASLPPEAETLTELLAAAGYRTAGFTANVLLDETSGVQQGFETYEAVIDLEGWGKTKLELFPNASGAEISAKALAWLRGLRAADPASPYFMYLHYMEPHTPYVCETTQPCRDGAKVLSERLVRGAWDFTPEESRLVRGLYAGEVQRADAVLGELLDSLLGEGLLDGTWVVVTADHGELLGEGQRYLHGDSLTLPEIRVPLLVRAPDARGRPVDLPVSLIDVAPTLLDLAGIAVPPGFLGRSLRPALEGGSLAARPVVSELYARREAEPRERLVAVAGSRRISVGADGSLTLSEGVGGAARPATRAELSALLGELAPLVDLEREPAQALPPLPDEMRERLRALGYEP